jgi:hypothetical protein
MEDFEDNYFNFHIEAEDYYPEKNNENFYNESNKIDEQKIISTGENHNSNNAKSEKNEINENQLINGQKYIYNNIDDMVNLEKNSDNKNLINDNILINSEIFQDNNKIDLLYLNRETNNSQYNTINGKLIQTTNDVLTNKFQEIFHDPEIDVDKLKDMQMIKKKRKRRTKEQIEKDKSLTQEEKIEKKPGRIKKGLQLDSKIKVNHSKDADDNIIKKINTHYTEEVRKWLNRSFLNEKRTNFQNEKYRKKSNKGIFLKLSPKLISTKIKKQSMMKIMETKFKDIFSSNEISSKYKIISKDSNKNLIDKIYKEGKEYFIIFILEMKFLDGLDYFSGQIPDEKIINYIKNNSQFSDELIKKFISNFDKIGKWMDKLYSKRDKDDKEIKNYLTKINVLCLNYKQSFEKKYIRGENKKNKNKTEQEVVDNKNN